ncbi:MAG TPA: TetR/AcrR family transcriptional regulator [Chitinophagaceae bacterium]|nr:TetR/AcrR family transcriptional regulator [Chitinophagaceae bacterium]
MGIRERKLKHKEDLKQSILDAAKQLFQREGYEATSIRKIAAEIEFSPTTIYLYYKDKAEIAHALHREGFKIMADQFRVLSYIEDPFERLKAMGRVYLQFAIDYADYYELMFVMKEPIQHISGCFDMEEWKEGAEAFHLLQSNIIACQEAGYFKGFDPTAFSMVVWSTMHGLCTLKLHGHLDHVIREKGLFEGVEDALQHTFETFVQFLKGTK